MVVRDIALGLFVAAVWGFNFVVMKAAVGEFPPLFLVAARFGLAGLIGLYFVRAPAAPWRLLTAYAVLFGIVKFSLLFSALAYGIGSGLASVVLQLQAPFTVLLAVLFAGERPSLAQGLGLGLAMVGLIAIAAGQGGTALVPFLMVVAAALAWAIANGVVKRAGSVDMLAFTVWSSLIVPLPMLGLSLAVEGPGAIAQALSQVSWIGVATLAYLVIPVSLVSVTLWNGLLGRYPAAAVAPFALLVPAIGLLAGAAVFGERQPVVVFIGCLLIGVGLAAVVFGPGRIPSGEASASRAKMET